jgi:hypothetical protein
VKTVILELAVAVVGLLFWVAVAETIGKTEEVDTASEVTVIDETAVPAVDETEDATVAGKVGAVNVIPLTEGIGSDNPALEVYCHYQMLQGIAWWRV